MEWMPIETAPRDGTALLGLWSSSAGTYTRITGANYGIVAYCDETNEWYDASENDNEDDVWCEPDYWMSLPPAANRPTHTGGGVTDRAFQLHCARVYIAQARVWRHRAAELPWYWRSFWQYLGYAAECRRKATAMREPQLDLFEAINP